MRLVDLNPKWSVETEALVIGPRREQHDIGQGMSFDCPCCVGKPTAVRLGLFIRNPVNAPVVEEGKLFERRGESFDMLSIEQEIDASSKGHWCGYIRGGCILESVR